MVITIATQNIWGFVPLWGLRRRAIAHALAGADIVLLQEVKGWKDGSQAHELAAEMGLSHAHFAPAGRTLCWRQGIAVISRWPAVHVVSQKLQQGRADLLDRVAPRAVLRVVLATPVGRWEVYATHWSLSQKARTRSAPAITEFVRRQRASAPADASVFGGDFNARFDEPSILEIGSACGLTDATKSGGPTFPAPWPLQRLDYLLLSPNLQVRRVQTRRSLGSDHRGVLAEVRFQEPPAAIMASLENRQQA